MSAPAYGASSPRRAGGWRLPRAVARAIAIARPVLPLATRILPFLALSAFATMHWTSLVEPSRPARALLVSVIATAAGVLLALSARVPRPAATVLRVVLVVLAVAAGAAAIGIRAKLLLPGHWGTLEDRISGGLSVVGSVSEWPYGGPNVWLRLTTLLAAPLAATLAAALAFWPPRRAGTVPGLRFAGLVPLVTLYVVASAGRSFGHQGVRGLALLAALAAWLWLPRLRGRDAAAALIAVLAAGLIGLGLTAKVAADQPWVDYQHWSWSLPKERTIAFDWRHRYGPLRWPRKGTTLLLIRSKHPHYWRAETLDRFDGYRWTTVPVHEATPNSYTVPPTGHENWAETVKVTVRGLRSQVLIGPGTIYNVAGDHQTVTLADATYVVDGQLASGDSYTARGYVPDPSVRAMRSAPPADVALTPSTAIELPGLNVGALVEMPLRGVPGTGTAGAAERLRHSPYARTFELARRLARGARSDYDVVTRIGSYLEGGYGYTENVARHRYPLASFLFGDKAGYCQQFSGAAALMLRMDGIPARVASGFAPGTLNRDTHEYVVRDLDAHSWIEVWFQDIGWVPFDPTPALAPASSQSATFAAPSAALGDSRDRPTPRSLALARGRRPDSAATAAGAGPAQNDQGSPWATVAIVALLVALAGGALALVARSRRRRRPLPASCGDADVDQLVRLLGRLGLVVDPRTTLLGLERRLQRLGGPDAAAYTRLLRERRFGDGRRPPPGRAERRRLRRLLAEAVEAGPLTRLHLALPERPVTPGLRSKLARLDRS